MNRKACHPVCGQITAPCTIQPVQAAMVSLDKKQGRKVWYSYWDRCMRNEHDFWTRFNYIHYNSVKHGYVDNPEDWEFSSYRFYVRNDENKWLNENLNDFPISDLFDDDKF